MAAPDATIRRLMRQRFATGARPRGQSSLLIPPSQAPQPTFGELGLFEKGMDLLSRPLYTVASFAEAVQTGRNPFLAALEGFAGTRRTTFGDVYRRAGLHDGAARAIMGFATDVLADPLTWVSAGTLGAAGRTGTALIRGVPRILSQRGVDLLEAATRAKTAQGARIAARGPARMTPLRKEILERGLSPEARGLLESGKIGYQEALGASYGKKLFERQAGVGETRLFRPQGPSLTFPDRVREAAAPQVRPGAALTPAQAKLPGVAAPARDWQKDLFAEKFIKAYGIPLVKTATVKRVLGAVPRVLYRPLEKIPRVGAGFTAVKDFASKAGGALRRVFSTRTKFPEFDVARTAAREIEHFRNIRSSEWWTEYRRQLLELAEPGQERLIDEELINAIEGIEKEVIKYEVPAERLAAIDAKIQEFERRIRPLLKREEAAGKVEEGLRRGMQDLEAKIRPEAVESEVISALQKSEPEVRETAVTMALQRARADLKATIETDYLTMLKGRTSKLTLDRNARALIDKEVRQELVKSGVVRFTNKSFGVGDDLEEIAIKGGAEDVASEGIYGMGREEGFDEMARRTDVGKMLQDMIQAAELRIAKRKAIKRAEELVEQVKSEPRPTGKQPKQVSPEPPPQSIPRPVEEPGPGQAYEPVEHNQPIKIPSFDEPVPAAAVPEIPPGPARVEIPREDMAAAVSSLMHKRAAKLTEELEGQIDALRKKLIAAQSAPARKELKRRISVLQKELDNLQERREQLAMPVGVMYKERQLIDPTTPGLRPLVEKFKQRMNMIFEREQATLAIPPEYRRMYLPHTMRHEIRQTLLGIIRQDPGRLVRAQYREGVMASLRRTQEGGIRNVDLDDLVERGVLDPSKIRDQLEEKGIYLTGDDLLAFEQDPVVAGLKRELAHNRAITAAEFARDIFSSPTLVKSRIDLRVRHKVLQATRELKELEEAKVGAESQELRGLVGRIAEKKEELARYQAEWAKVTGTLAQHPQHSIFIPTKAFATAFRTHAERQAIRAGEEHEKFIKLLQKILGEGDLDRQLDEAKDALNLSDEPIEAYIIPNEVAELLSKAYELPKAPEAIQDFLDVWDKWQAYWKLTATVIRPAFHVRNIISNLWQNFLAGVRDPRLYFLAFQMQKNSKNLGVFGKIGKWSAEQVYSLAEQLGVLRTGFIGGDVAEYMERTLRPAGWTPKSGPLKGIKGAGALLPTGPVARFAQKWGTHFEDNARLALFIDGLQKGMDPTSAAMRVKKFLFDYQELTTYEKAIFRRLVPFYAWTRKSIPLALEQLITNPGKVALLGKARAEMEKSVEGLDHEYVAEYINQSFGIPVRKNADGTYSYFLLKGYIPTVDLAKMDPQELLGMLTPFVKVPMETIFNIDFYRMKPIRRFPTEMVEFMGVPMPVNLAHILRNAIYLAQIDREIFREGFAPMKALMSEMSFRTQQQDPVSQMRRYVLSAQMEIGELRRAAERARAQGRDAVASGLEGRVARLEARREDAKRKVLRLDPDAFKYERRDRVRKPRYEAPSLDAIKRRTRLDNIIRRYQRQSQSKAKRRATQGVMVP